MSDIVERLRAAADKSESGGGEWYQLIHRCREAADEIDRLRYRLGIESVSPRYTVGELADLAAVCDGLDADIVEAALEFSQSCIDLFNDEGWVGPFLLDKARRANHPDWKPRSER